MRTAHRPKPVALKPRALHRPLYTTRVPAGFPSPADDYVELPLDLNDYLIDKPASTFHVRVQGWSMRDAGIMCGDVLIVDRSKTPTHYAIVLAIVEGEFTVKRLDLHKKLLRPENPDYRPIPITDHTEMWGVVVGVVRKVG